MSKKQKDKTPTAKSKVRRTIGYVARYLADNNSCTVWQGVIDTAREHDVNVISFFPDDLGTTHGFDGQANILYDLINADMLDGLVIWTAALISYAGSEGANRIFEHFRSIPIVDLERGGPEDIPYVEIDSYQSMREAVIHLIRDHGYRRIAFIRGPDTTHAGARERYQGYLDTLAEFGIPFDPDLVSQPTDGSWRQEVGEEAIALLLDQRHASFEAVIGVCDNIAIGAMRALDARGIHIPSQVAVIGFDDETGSRNTIPPLTTMSLRGYEQGRQAVQALLTKLDGDKIPTQAKVPPQLIIRQSCGCIDPAVIQAAIGPVSIKGESLEAFAANQREKVLSEIRQAAGKTMEELDPGWGDELLEAFFAELKAGKPGGFLSALDGILRQVVVSEGQVDAWANVISALRRCTLPYLENNPLLLQAEDLWLQGQVMVGRTAQQAQRYQAAQLEEQTQIMNEIMAALITTFNMDDLMDTLARELPRLGIPGCYLSLYENPKRPTEISRLMLAYDKHGGRLDLEAEKQVFPSPRLVPDGKLPQERRYNLVTAALYFREEQLGFVLFEAGPRKGQIYGMLREQISSALQGALLVQRVQERSAEVTRQQYILDTFMENVPDRIYFKDVQSRMTQTNRAFAIKLGVQDPGELIGKSDFDFFPADQAEIKYQQEQEIIKTGQPILGLEEPDGIDRWALTTKMPLRDEKGTTIGTFGISSDITELVKAKQAAEAAVKEADKARALAEIEKEKAEAAKDEAEKAHYAMEMANQTLAAQMWQTTGQALLNEKMRGEQDVSTLANNVIQQLCKYLNVDNGAIYILEDDILRLTGTYAYRRKSLVQQYLVGEGKVGQAVVEKEIIIKEFPEDYIALSLRQGKPLPRYNLFAPVVYNQQVSGVVTLESMTAFTPAQMGFLEKALESVAIAFMTSQARTRVNELFAKTRQQAEELQAQEEELRATNEELEAQTDNLRASETHLKANQAALEAANVDLEEKTHNLQEKQAILDSQNQVLRDAQQELERKAEELTVTNKYKSEFLANMSHELRTPLNSLLILSRLLANNEDGNLTSDQVESAQIISASGADLLNLINDILDLSKVEAGHMNFTFAEMPLENLARSMRVQFEHVAEEKGLKYEVGLGEGLPESITTDYQRVEQVVKNLLSNAFKFTEKGSVQLRIELDGEMIAIRVRDSGIGMTPEQQQRIFEAFQQADGSTSRKYGGTGLGLTISREMSIKLGGRIGLESELGKGSVFTLYLPCYRSVEEVTPAAAPVSAMATPPNERSAPLITKKVSASSKPAKDDRDKIKKGDRVLLVVEDDAKFAKVLLGYAHKKDFKCVLAGDGESGLKLAAVHPPDAILLDLKLPGMSGWEVLDTLKGDASLRHIPVHILSATPQTMDAYKRGALGFLNKPISQDQLDGVFATIGEFLSRGIKSLLIVEDDSGLRHSVGLLLGGSDVKISEAASGAAALTLLRKTRFDCMILDLSLPDMSGFELLSKINQDETVSKCPVIVYTGKELSEEENKELLKYASSVIIKGVKSPERLLDETALFLHRVVADMPAEKQDTIRRLHDHNAVFSGKHILVVDDDMRNAFALSRLLGDRELRVTMASSGAKALETLNKVPDIDLILMDIMMPEMDGYETMQKIRAQAKFKNLPIMALTAKAMKGDQEKCIAAGANDFLSKPVDADRLFSMLRVWLYR